MKLLHLLFFCFFLLIFACKNVEILTLLLGINWRRTKSQFCSPPQDKKFSTYLSGHPYLNATVESLIPLAILATFLASVSHPLFSISTAEQCSPLTAQSYGCSPVCEAP